MPGLLTIAPVPRGHPRWPWIFLAAVPVLLLGGDYAYWRLAAANLRHGFDVAVVRAKAAGWDVRFDSVVPGGWPDTASLRVENVSIAIPGLDASNAGRIRWGSDAILLRSRLIRPDVVTLIPIGPHAPRLNDDPPVAISADLMRLSLSFDPSGQPRTLHAEAGSFAAVLPGRGTLGVGRFDLRVEIDASANRDQPALTFSLEAHPIALPDAMGWSLGPDIRDVVCEGSVNGPLPSGHGLVQRATSWRDEGGSLEIRKIAIDWGPAKFNATATLALDEELQPMGAGTGKIAGYEAALDALAANAALTRSGATAAKAVLSLLANSPADGQPDEVEVPLTLQYRTLSVRQVPLVRLPELEWPAP